MIAPMSLSMAQLSEETGISTWTLYHWRKQVVRERGGGTIVAKSKYSGKESAARKLAVVVETFAFNEAELAEYCRKQSLYPDQIKA